MQKAVRSLNLDLKESLTLEDLVSSRRTPERVRIRCQIVLLAAQGRANTQIADQLRVSRPTVQEWRRRYKEEGLPALLCDAKLTEDVQQDERLVRLKELLDQPSSDGTPWTIRSLATALEASPTTVHRLLEAGGLNDRPKAPREVRLEGQIERILGIYVHPPHHAVALECSDRTEPPRAPIHPDVRPGTPGWHLLLHLRSIEALRSMEGFTTHYPSNVLRFIRRIQAPPVAGRSVVVVTDLGLEGEYLTQLAQERPRLKVVNLPCDLPWLDALRTGILPFLQTLADEGIDTHLTQATGAAEAFLRENQPDPLLWVDGVAPPLDARESVGPIPLLFPWKPGEGFVSFSSMASRPSDSRRP